ncbi:MAG: histidine kinase dimerization/phospho-acceptor domain-containing protein [Sphingomicrobium sp.]
MRYDDRLLTVLGQPAGDRRDVAVRWRQLVDLIARAGPNSGSAAVARAIEEIRDQSAQVDDELRAATARAVAALPLPLGLLEVFAADKLAVGAPVLAAATLDSAQWRALLALADPETSRFIETLHPELRPEPAIGGPPGTPPADPPREPANGTEPIVLDLTEPFVEQPPPPTAGPSLHDVVERMERRRQTRDRFAGGPSPRPGAPSLFRWECGPSGEITWIEGAARGPLIGRSIARSEDSAGNRVGPEVVRAFAVRAPFRDAAMSVAGAGAVAGEWRISGVPAFEPADGRFAGYRGVALREEAATAAPSSMLDALADPDSLRELVHEIKTPLNAIIGFAEIIDGQYLGPADHRYRERASEIVVQAHVLLTAIDDLDFAAKTHSARRGAVPRTSLGPLLEGLAPALRERASARGVELEFARSTGPVPAAVQPELADRLIFRLASAAIDQAASGERLRVALEATRSGCQLVLSRPVALRGHSDEELFGSRGGDLGGEFSLRLVRGLARIAGADLKTSAGGLALIFGPA